MRLALLLIWLAVGNACAEELKYPPTKEYETRIGYWFQFNEVTKLPRWTAEHYTKDTLQQNVNRDSNPFRGDPAVPLAFRVTPADYKGTGYDMGHMAAANAHRSSAEALRETFLMTNMCPQEPKCNRGWWKSSEAETQKDGIDSDEWVISLPVFLDRSGKATVKVSKTIGNKVAVPTHFAKSTLVKRSGKLTLKSWLGPNAAVEDLNTIRVSVDEIEAATGINLWQGIPNEDSLESVP